MLKGTGPPRQSEAFSRRARMKGHELNNATAQEILQRLPEHEHGGERHRSAMRPPQGTERHPTQELNQENLHCLDGHDLAFHCGEGRLKAW